MRQTAFTELVGCVRPLQLAGMGGPISDVRLAAAVTNAGGLGMLGAGGLPAAALHSMLDAMSQATAGPYGVNFLVPFMDREMVQLAARHSKVCDFHFGRPDASYVEVVHDGGALAGWQVGTLEEALLAVEAGCEFIIVQGVEAGGHVRGHVALDELFGNTAASVHVPIVAAGGIGTPEKVRTLLDSGAAAVRIGTRFVAALESPAHPAYIDALIAASATDTVITEIFGADWPDAPHRVLRSSIEAVMAVEGDVVGTIGAGEQAWVVPRRSSMPPVKDAHGNIAAMAQYAGTSVEHVRRRQPVADIVEELCRLL